MMTPAQAQTLQTLMLAMAGLGVVETLMGIWYSRSAGPQKNISQLFLFAGPGFLVGAAILHWAWDYVQSLTVAIAIVGACCVFGGLRMVRASKEAAGDRLQ